MKNKVLILFFLLSSILICFSETKTLSSEDVILNDVSSLIKDNQNQKAAKRINEVIENYMSNETDLPENIVLMAEAAYSSWLDELYKAKNIQGYQILRENLKMHPFAASSIIKKRLSQMHELECEEILKKKNEASKKLNSAEWVRLDETYTIAINKQNDLLAILQGYKTISDIHQEKALMTEMQKQKNLKNLFICFVIILVIGICILIILLIKKTVKHRKTEEQFEMIMNVVSLMNRPTESKIQLPIEDLQTINKFARKMEPNELLKLEKDCNELGYKIDSITGRKNNSQKVGSLVYKMAKKIGVQDEIAIIYFCAAMVYDAGFLAVDKNIFEAEHLTVKQRYVIRDHVTQAVGFLGFVPKDVLPIFLEAAEYHHENLDGSGYNDGIKGREIPLVAKLIHTAESYTSLVNKRKYHEILDKEAAISELKSRPGVYDPKTIEVLEEIV